MTEHANKKKPDKALAKRPSKGFIGAFLGQIYHEKKDRLLRRVFNLKRVKPFMKYREIRIVEEVLINLKPRTCLEWGAGYSSLYFPAFLPEGSKWFSIEHDKDWAERVREMNENPCVEIFHVGPERNGWADAGKEGAAADFKSYLAFPEKFKKADFILIDGRARKAAIAKALELISDSGVVVLHDANRGEYHGPLKLYRHGALFTDGRADGGGVWVGSKKLDLNSVLDISLHKRLWKVYNMF